MLATGGLLVSIALLTLAMVGPVFRSSDPPEWTTRGWIGELVTLAIVCTLAIGIGYLGAGAISTWQTGPDYLDVGLLAAVLFVAVAIGRRLRLRARPRAVEADASVHAFAPGSGQAHSDSLVATTQAAPVRAREPPPPHKAA